VAAGVIALILLQVASPVRAGEPIVAARLWPSLDYTRLTLETRRQIRFSLFSVTAPERLVLDLEAVDFGPTLEALQGQIRPDDPYIAGLRAARNRPGVVRLVIELKREVRAQAFALKPIAQYGHRLVLDLYPLVPPDPLAALIALDGNVPKLGENERARARQTRKALVRGHRLRASPRSSSTRVTGARIRARSVGAEHRKRTSLC